MYTYSVRYYFSFEKPVLWNTHIIIIFIISLDKELIDFYNSFFASILSISRTVFFESLFSLIIITFLI